jgi:hypothetical protein
MLSRAHLDNSVIKVYTSGLDVARLPHRVILDSFRQLKKKKRRRRRKKERKKKYPLINCQKEKGEEKTLRGDDKKMDESRVEGRSG